jgi:ribosomal protein S18 acetylase RimI-like enzyme
MPEGLEVARFTAADFDEYASWFVDNELNERLGPIDEIWLDAVLSDSKHFQFVFRDPHNMVGVMGIDIRQDLSMATVTDVAVKPGMRRRKLAHEMLKVAMSRDEFRTVTYWYAIVESDNAAARKLLIGLGWAEVGPDETSGSHIQYATRV